MAPAQEGHKGSPILSGHLAATLQDENNPTLGSLETSGADNQNLSLVVP